MKHKKKLSLVILIFFIVQQNTITYCAAFPCNLFYMNSDRQVYYYDDMIFINASWELDYDTETQISYVKIQVFNSQNANIWESPQYDEIGIYEGNWTIDIELLNLSLSNSTSFLYIKLLLYFYDFYYTDYIYDYLKIIQIQLTKKEICYQISGFNDHLNKADNLDFYIQFYYEYLENITYIVNQTVSFELIKNDITLYNQFFISNEEGIIHISLNNITEISFGSNKIKILIENPLFDTLTLEFELFIDNTDLNNEIDILFFVIIVPGIIIGIGISILFYKSYKKARQKSLTELTIEI